MLVKMQEIIDKRPEKKNSTTKKLNKLYLSKDTKYKSYKKKVEKETILKYILQGKSVQDIYDMMRESGVSLKTISKMRRNAIIKNENLAVENLKLEQVAINMLNNGFSARQVYQLLKFDISLPRILELRNNVLEIKSKEKENDIDID